MNGLFKFFRESYVARFLIPIGVILIVTSIIFFVVMDKTKDYIKVDAVVTRLELAESEYTDEQGGHHDATYSVYVKYSVNEQEHENILGEYSGYSVGDKLVICYNPNNPDDISTPNSVILPIVMLSLGVASLGGGVASIVVAVKKNNRLKEQEKEWENGN